MPSTVAQSGSVATNINYQGHPWSNVANAATSDADFASIAVAANGNTDWIQVTGFNFSSLIPNTATVLGILVEVEISCTVNFTYQNPAVQLVSGGGDLGNLDASRFPSLTTTPSYKSIGDNKTLWGIAGDVVSQVRDPGFGIKVRLRSDAGNSGPATAKIHHIRVTISYKYGTIVGPKFGSTAEDLMDVTGVWVNPSNVLTENGAVATTFTSGDDSSNNLLVTGLNANLPEFVADSLTILVELKASGNGTSGNIGRGQLVTNSGDTGDIGTLNISGFTNTLTWYMIGDGDWNHSWTRSEVNDSTFGFKFNLTSDDPSEVMSVDAVRITFQFTEIGSNSPTLKTLSIGMGIKI